MISSCHTHKTVYYKQCSSCLHDLAKAEKQSAKEESKRQKAISKANLKAKEPKPAIKKVSDKQKDRLKEYAKVRKQFLLGRWCAYHGQGCIPTEVHHGAGKIGDLLTDTRYFVAVCRDAHNLIEAKPKWAKENGYSQERLNK